MDEDSKRDEEQVVEDTDADTRDVEDTQQDEYADMSKRLTRMEDAINRMSGVVSAMQKAQSSLVDMGAVIRENPSDDTTSDDEGFVPLEKLDFSI